MALQLRKCGNILLSTDNRLYAIDCIYCGNIYTIWKDFLGHVRDEHNLLVEIKEPKLKPPSGPKIKFPEFGLGVHSSTETLVPQSEGDPTPTNSQTVVEIVERGAPQSPSKNESSLNYINPIYEDCEQGDQTDDGENIQDSPGSGGNVINSADLDNVDTDCNYCSPDEDEISLLELKSTHSATTQDTAVFETVPKSKLDERLSYNLENDSMIPPITLVPPIPDVIPSIRTNRAPKSTTSRHTPRPESIESQRSPTPVPSEILNEPTDVVEEIPFNENASVIPCSATERPHAASSESSICQITFEATPEIVVLAFIEKVRQHDCLWYRKSPLYGNEEACREAYCDIANTFQMSALNAQRSVRFLLNWYHCEQQQPPKKPMSFDPSHEKYAKYFGQCAFLRNNTTKGASSKHLKSERPYCTELFRCTLCNKDFGTRKCRDSHMRYHFKKMPYQCHYCGQRANTPSEMSYHLRMHSTNKPYSCNRCNKRFRTNALLTDHQRQHDRPNLKCSFCGKTFTVPAQFREHMHLHYKRPQHACPFCSKMCMTAKTLCFHMLSAHPDLRNPYMSLFETKSKLKRISNRHLKILLDL